MKTFEEFSQMSETERQYEVLRSNQAILEHLQASKIETEKQRLSEQRKAAIQADLEKEKTNRNI